MTLAKRIVDEGPVDHWLRRLAPSLEEVPGLVGAWVHGSAASGDWVPGVSDVDAVVAWEAATLDAGRAVPDATTHLPAAVLEHAIPQAIEPTPEPRGDVRSVDR